MSSRNSSGARACRVSKKRRSGSAASANKTAAEPAQRGRAAGLIAQHNQRGANMDQQPGVPAPYPESDAGRGRDLRTLTHILYALYALHWFTGGISIIVAVIIA